MANPFTTCHLPTEHQQPEVAMELSGQSSDLSLDPSPPAEKKHTFGMFTLLSLEKSDFGMLTEH